MKEWVGEYLETRGMELNADIVLRVIEELIVHIDHACKEIDWETLEIKVKPESIGIKVRGERKTAEEEEEWT